MMSDLYKKTYRGYLVDHHTPDHPGVGFERLDAAEWERFIEEARLDHLMVYCKDHWGYSYYDTAIGKKHPALGERDWVGELEPVLRRHGIEFTAYYCFEYDSYAPKAHPEWSTINRDDVPLVCGMPTNSSNARWGMPCYETDYRAYILGQLKEIVERFRPDSLFIDIFGKSMCYCDTCRRRFRERFGYDAPRTDAELMARNEDLVEFLDESAARMLEDVKKVVKAIDPELALTVNFAAHYPKRIRDGLDYMYTEPWAGNWLSGAYARDISGGKPVQLGPGNVSRVYNYENVNLYRLATAEIAAQGCHVFLYSEALRTDGSLEMEEARRIGVAYREVEKFQPYLQNRRVYAEIGVVQSDLADALRVDQPMPMRSISRALTSGLQRQAILGAMQMCDHVKLPWKIIPDTELCDEALRGLKMLILPNVFHIGAAAATLLRGFVERGGVLLLSGENGVLDARGHALPDFALAELMGCHFIGKDESYRKNKWCGYIRPSDDAIWRHAPQTTPPVEGYQLRLRPDGAAVPGSFIDPAVKLSPTEWINWGNPQPGRENGFPAICENRVGDGCVVTLGFDMCTMYPGDYPWLRTLVCDLMEKYIEPDVALRTELRDVLELSFYRQNDGGDLIVHEISAMARLTGGAVTPMPGGTLEISDGLGRVRAAAQVYPVERKLTLRRDEARCVTCIDLADVEIHNIYRISLEGETTGQ